MGTPGTTIAIARLAVGTLGSAGAGRRRSIGLLETVEGDLAGLGVDLDDLDFDGIAEIEDVFDLADASVGHAADMKQAVLVRRQLHWMPTTVPS